MSLITAQNLSHHFIIDKQPFHILKNTDFILHDQEIVAILGQSGSGKSTLLRLFAGLINPAKGTIHSSDCSMVFQNYALLPWLTVAQNISFGLEAQKISSKNCEKQVNKILNIVGLEQYKDAYPKELSGGMKQRIGFARALITEPKVLLMDEPFSALDIFTAEKLRQDLLHLWQDNEINTRSMILVTHDIEEALFLADRILLLDHNKKNLREMYTATDKIYAKESRPTDHITINKLKKEIHACLFV